jgi:hypothetical protein
MSGRLTGAERIPPPAEFNAALASMFGHNRFGGALYRMVWGQTEVMKVRGLDRRYTEKLVGHNEPCWCLQRWCAPEMFWTPELYYAMSCDEDGLSLTGEYPQFGYYDTVIKFIEKRIVDRELTIETIPLSMNLFESLIPVLEAAEQLTMAQLAECDQQMEARENAEKIADIMDRMEAGQPAFLTPVSFAGQTNRSGSVYTRQVEEKRVAIEREWKRRGVAKNRPKPRRGFYQGETLN